MRGKTSLLFGRYGKMKQTGTEVGHYRRGGKKPRKSGFGGG